jgi:hypothetical protein
MPNYPPCATCGRPRNSWASTECTTCSTYRYKFGKTRPFGLTDGRLRRGVEHPRWHGDAVAIAARRKRTERLFPVLGECALCGNRPAVSRHHWDKNPANNDAANIASLCRSCHSLLHAHGYVTA